MFIIIGKFLLTHPENIISSEDSEGQKEPFFYCKRRHESELLLEVALENGRVGKRLLCPVSCKHLKIPS